ncbi:MAG TPA: HAD-IC family P-type ATPase [Candidatus Pacearchaeota archaeon]|nr:HAD-IC family P-type ATPase [Candidatus Pacearchaeota archaeon]
MEKLYHNISSAIVVKILNSDCKNGLTKKEVAKRKISFGKNIIAEEKNYSALKLFLNQFKSPLMYILVFAGLFTLFINNYTDSIVIFLATLINALFGFFEENKISHVLKKLKSTLKTKTTVLRDGVKREVYEEELVPGDIIYLKAGQRIPADARLISANNLKVSEAALTGEWLAEDKISDVLPKETVLADRINMVYMGGLIENGTGKAVVVATGKRTETGKIAELIDSTKEVQTPLQERILSFSKFIGITIAAASILIFLFGILLRDLSWIEMFETSIAIAVGGIPEALPIVITVILAIGGEKILRKQGLIRKLASVETLGSTQIICFDKTKTLTEGKMRLNNIITDRGELALKASVLCSDAYLDDKGSIIGSPTGCAILEGALNNNFNIKQVLESEELQNLPFNSENKYALSLRKDGNKRILYICGAPEKLIKKSKNAHLWEEEIKRLAEKGLRVVGVGYKEIKKTNKDLNKIANDFDFIGLLSFIDPLRVDVREAIETCKKAGIKTILATGDHALTAKRIAEEIGLEIGNENIMDGQELDNLNDTELLEKIGKIKVFARVEPRHKLRIVDMWQKKGKVIAMTGDGINDAPAIKKADIGIALGSGTEVAKEASDLVLLDDSFNTIVKTIKEGRIALDNLRKSLSYSLADSFASIILIGFSTIIFGWPLPVLAVQILWNNLIEDTFPGMAFAFEPKEKNVMERKPAKKTNLMTKEMKVLIFATGIIDEFLILLSFYFLYFVKGFELEYVRTVVFAMMSIDTVFTIFCYKNLRKNLWQINPFSNIYLNFACIFVIILCFAAIYLPILQTFLKTVSLDIFAWIIIILIAILSVVGIELTKYFFITKHHTEE